MENTVKQRLNLCCKYYLYFALFINLRLYEFFDFEELVERNGVERAGEVQHFFGTHEWRKRMGGGIVNGFVRDPLHEVVGCAQKDFAEALHVVDIEFAKIVAHHAGRKFIGEAVLYKVFSGSVDASGLKKPGEVEV